MNLSAEAEAVFGSVMHMAQIDEPNFEFLFHATMSDSVSIFAEGTFEEQVYPS